MNSYVHLVNQLSEQVNSLSERSQTALFWACALALVPEFRQYATMRGQSEAPLDQILAIAEAFAQSGVLPDRPELERLLSKLDDECPVGDSPDYFPHTNAQDCCICADVCIRQFVEATDPTGNALWFALEPIMQATTMKCFGVADVGSGPREEDQMQVVQNQPSMVAAIDFCRWAIQFLKERPAPTAGDLALLRSRAPVLTP